MELLGMAKVMLMSLGSRGDMEPFLAKAEDLLEETDPMTEERVRRTKMTLEGRDFVVNYYRKADEFRVEMALALIGERNFIVEEGTELSLKLGNGDIEVFKAAQRATPISYVAGTQVATNYNATFYCTQSQMALLAEHGFSVASIKLGDETVTRVVKEKKGGQDPRKRPVHLGRLTTFQLPPLSRIGILDTRRRCQMVPPLRIHPM